MSAHTITTVQPFDATEAGALSGHEAVCSCGFVTRTSLSANVATRQGNEHADYMNRKEA